MVPQGSVLPAGHHVHVVVASKNMVKVNAFRAAADKCFRTINARPVVTFEEAPSGVPDQPWGDEETLQGARNRAAALLKHHPNKLVVAIEGGVGGSLAQATTLPRPAGGTPPPVPALSQAMPQPQEPAEEVQARAPVPRLECFAWVVAVFGPTGAEGVARSASFELPAAVSALVLQGMELGHADDQVFKRTQSGQGSGTVGRLSHGLITRQLYYEHACSLALLPFLNPGYYGPEYSLTHAPDSAAQLPPAATGDP